MSDDKVFDTGDKKTPENTGATPPTFQIPDPVKEFVGEGKKYATVEEALKSIPHAQKHIESLKQAAESAKQEAEALKAKQEAYEALIREQREKGGDPNPKPAELDPLQVEELVKRTLERDRQVAEAKANVSKVREELVKRFGDKASEVFANRGKELGIDINALAATSPVAVLELFPKADPAPNPSGTINPSALPKYTRPAEHKNIMAGATTEDLLAAWRRARPQ